MKLISAQETAKILGCAESTIRTNAKKGVLGFQAVKVGALWKFRDEEVYEYVYGKNWRSVVASNAEENNKSEPVEIVVVKPSVRPMTNVVPLAAREVKENEELHFSNVGTL